MGQLYLAITQGGHHVAEHVTPCPLTERHALFLLELGHPGEELPHVARDLLLLKPAGEPTAFKAQAIGSEVLQFGRGQRGDDRVIPAGLLFTGCSLQTFQLMDHLVVLGVHHQNLATACILLVLRAAVEVDGALIVRLFGGAKVAVGQLTNRAQAVGHSLGVRELDGVGNVYAANVSGAEVEHIGNSGQGSTKCRE